MQNNRLNESVIGSAKVIVDILPKGYCVPDRKLNSIGYITIHNTGSMAPAINQHNYMKNINKSGERKASWHFSVDDKEIYQAQSCNFEMWHAGDSTGNKNSIGIEICQSDNKDTQEKIYLNAIELVKILMKYYNIPINKVVQHNKWSGKDCPQYLRSNKFGFNWNWFIDKCNSTNEKPPVYNIVTGGFGAKENAQKQLDYLHGLTGWYLELEEQRQGDFRIRTGGFTGEDRVKREMAALTELTGWWCTYEKEK